MRWYRKSELQRGEIRIISKFLWLPLIIGKETRWLEKATIKQIYTGHWVTYGPDYQCYWKTYEFVD